MKKNTFMRLAAVLLVLTLLSTSVIGGTFAKYTTSVVSQDSARVAYWGFQRANTLSITGLFSDTYGSTVDSVGTGDAADDVIAPGTSGKATFSFAWDENTKAWDGTSVTVTGPEVAYNFTVAVNANCDDAIANNDNIQWALVKNTYSNGNYTEVNLEDITEWGKWADLIDSIKALSGAAVTNGVQGDTKQYGPNELPDAFSGNDDQYTIAWRWVFETANDDQQDTADTAMGNADLLDDCSIEITITATQVN